jgi:hypothetical protein
LKLLLFQLKKPKFVLQNHKPGNAWWLGLSDKLLEGTFLWNSTGSALVSYANWASNEPNGGTSENCVVIKSSDGGWVDIRCTNSYWTMCEKVLRISPKGEQQVLYKLCSDH